MENTTVPTRPLGIRTPGNRTPQDATAPGGVTRRRFLTGAVVAGAGFTVAGGAGQAYAQDAPGGAQDAVSSGASGAFLHSVASGDPWPDSVVIWTRVTPTPEATPGSGAGAPTKVRWEVATDPGFGASTVASGEQVTDATVDHTVKVNVTGLTPATDLHYRFTVLDGPATGATSRVGRTRTSPALEAEPDNVRFGVCSCSNYEAGYFRAYRELADRGDVEFILHLGDYTYEYDSGEYGAAYGEIVRTVEPAQRTRTLTGYRIRQGHYHRDRDLADLHAAKPMICIWDDHEFFDNAWRDGATGDSEYGGPAEYAEVRRAATQAYYEWMPVRAGKGFNTGEDRHLYRHLRYGRLFELILPDLRTYRDLQGPLNTVNDSSRTMMGTDQFGWFGDVLTTSSTTWQLIGNSVMFAPMTLPNTLDPRVHDWLVDQVGVPPDGVALNTDQWDGYMVERQRIIDLIAERRAKGSQPGLNVVFLTGDIHSSWAADIPASAADYRLRRDMDVVAAEFIVPSVTAGSAYDAIVPSPVAAPAVKEALRVGQDALTTIDHWYKYVDLTRHGMMVVDVDSTRTQVDWFHGEVLQDDAPMTYTTSWQTRVGDPGARPAAGPLQ